MGPTLMLAALLATSPARVDHAEAAKNDWVRYSVRLEPPRTAHVKYVFKDFTGRSSTFSFTADLEAFYAASHVFGAPPWLQGDFLATERAQREAELRAHLMRIQSGRFSADPVALVRYYDGVTRSVAALLLDELQQRHLDTRANRIAMALAFVQDIPYREVRDAGAYRQGILPAPEMLLDGYGDCDTKAIFFAGLMVALVGVEDVVLLVNAAAEHSLAAVRGTPGPGQTFIIVDGSPFLVAEVAGPRRIPLDEKGLESPDAFDVERLGAGTTTEK